MITGSASNSTSLVTVLVAVFGVLLTLIGALSMIIFNDIRKRVTDNTRHLQGLMATIGPLMWRLISVEDYLEQKHGYRPPRDIGWVEDYERRRTRDG